MSKLTPEVMAEYVSLTDAGNPPGAETLRQAEANVASKTNPRPQFKATEVASLRRLKVVDHEEARQLLGLPKRNRPVYLKAWVVHLILTLATGGFWLPVWLASRKHSRH